MNQEAPAAPDDEPIRQSVLTPPTYAAVLAERRPTLGEIRAEWIDSIAFWRSATRWAPFLYVLFNAATFGAFVAFFALRFSWAGLAGVLAAAFFIGTVYNTVWFHRYCSHQAFKFRNLFWARVFLWTNPAGFREESYVIPHRVHHAKSDGPGDPYGPHLGWFGSYLASESSQKTNPKLPPDDYARLVRSLSHIGFPANAHATFARTGSVEPVAHYAARIAVAALLWGGFFRIVAGPDGPLAWFAGVFLYTFLVRDFNYRGHGGYFGEHPEGSPLNHIFYGFIAGEWHENHHLQPRLAHSGFQWWQLDIPYFLIRLMHRCGIVTELRRRPDPTPARAAAQPA